MKIKPSLQQLPNTISRSESILKTSPSLNSLNLFKNNGFLIPTNGGDSCSKVCQNSTMQEQSPTEFATIQEIDLKIKKLRLSIMLQYVQEVQPNNKKYLMRSEELCNSILSIKETNEKSIKYLKDFNEETNILIEKYEGTQSIKLLLKMLQSLCFAKLSTFRIIILLPVKKPILKSRSLGNKLDNINKIQQSLQTSREFKNKLNQHKRNSLDSYIIEAKERSQSQMSKLFPSFQSQKLDQRLNKENVVKQLERMFYVKCLDAKAKLPNHNQAQQLLYRVLQIKLINKIFSIKKQDQFIDTDQQKCQIILEAQQSPNKYPQPSSQKQDKYFAFQIKKELLKF